jgi:hypothetical protein
MGYDLIQELFLVPDLNASKIISGNKKIKEKKQEGKSCPAAEYLKKFQQKKTNLFITRQSKLLKLLNYLLIYFAKLN